jgi:hypothetical protein
VYSPHFYFILTVATSSKQKWKIKAGSFRASNSPGGNRRKICGNLLQLYIQDLAIKKEENGIC